MKSDQLVIATRQSKLALWQANYVRDRLCEVHPGLSVKLLGMTTKGDQWLNAPLATVGGKGLFIKELEQALADGRADLAVHSVKDVPAQLPEGFVMPVVAFRDDVRDALVSTDGEGLFELPAQARIGSSSLRRQAQLLLVREDLRIGPIRGNVETRLRKLEAGDFDALVLAAAGLHRLNLQERVTQYLNTDLCLPAAGQGALGLECRANDPRVLDLLQPLADVQTFAVVAAERMVSAKLGADCSAPLAAHGTLEGPIIHLRALLAAPDGSRVIKAAASGEDPQVVGGLVAESLLDQGAHELLAVSALDKPSWEDSDSASGEEP